MTLNNETPARFALTTDVEIINKRINIFKYYNTNELTRESLSPNVGSMTWPM
jgi:hypothetical protein